MGNAELWPHNQPRTPYAIVTKSDVRDYVINTFHQEQMGSIC